VVVRWVGHIQTLEAFQQALSWALSAALVEAQLASVVVHVQSCGHLQEAVVEQIAE
jgi:hypothetical protein